MSDDKTAPRATTTRPPTERVASRYAFKRVEGRNEGLELFDALLDWLDRRSREHEERGNDELLGEARNVSQQVMGCVERLCKKWEESDERGLTY